MGFSSSNSISFREVSSGSHAGSQGTKTKVFVLSIEQTEDVCLKTMLFNIILLITIYS